MCGGERGGGGGVGHRQPLAPLQAGRGVERLVGGARGACKNIMRLLLAVLLALQKALMDKTENFLAIISLSFYVVPSSSISKL